MHIVPFSNGTLSAMELSDSIDVFSDVEKKDGYLSVDQVTSDSQEKLLDSSEDYSAWIRILVLRILVSTPGWKTVVSSGGIENHELNDLTGIHNLHKVIAVKGGAETRLDLRALLQQFESAMPASWVFPEPLTQKLEELAGIVGLATIDKGILGLAILLRTEPAALLLEEFLGYDIHCQAVPRLLAAGLGITEGDVQRALSPSSPLVQSGLMSLDTTPETSPLNQHIDLITRSFANLMVTREGSLMSVFGSLIRESTPCKLSDDAYRHIDAQVAVATALLKRYAQGHRRDVTLLIYGPAGTGKSQLARRLAENAGLRALEVVESSENRVPLKPQKRIRACRFAQALLKDSNSLLILDECEEIIEAQQSDEPIVKSWINHLLDDQDTPPTIWIANSASGFDPAFLRRFSLCIHVPIPPRRQRLQILESCTRGRISPATLEAIASSPHVSPAIMEKAGNIALEVAEAGVEQTDVTRTTLLLVNQKLAAMQYPEIQVSPQKDLANRFDPRFTKTSQNLESIKEGLIKGSSGRILCSGAPGTGKSAFGHWLSEELDRPLLLMKGSDLLDRFVGGTEQKIAQAFREARHDGAILQFDEIDTFLQNRGRSEHQWEITQVNEMLMQMEFYEGIFIASTNLQGVIDPAAARRFDVHVEFDFPGKEAIQGLYQEVSSLLDLEPANDAVWVRLDNIRWLTPGDFAQTLRRARFLPVKSHHDLLNQLADTASRKQGHVRRIGF
jgi:transitional endoplasmic reticulum ATPase